MKNSKEICAAILSAVMLLFTFDVLIVFYCLYAVGSGQIQVNDIPPFWFYQARAVVLLLNLK